MHLSRTSANTAAGAIGPLIGGLARELNYSSRCRPGPYYLSRAKSRRFTLRGQAMGPGPWVSVRDGDAERTAVVGQHVVIDAEIQASARTHAERTRLVTDEEHVVVADAAQEGGRRAIRERPARVVRRTALTGGAVTPIGSPPRFTAGLNVNRLAGADVSAGIGPLLAGGDVDLPFPHAAGDATGGIIRAVVAIESRLLAVIELDAGDVAPRNADDPAIEAATLLEFDFTAKHPDQLTLNATSITEDK